MQLKVMLFFFFLVVFWKVKKVHRKKQKCVRLICVVPHHPTELERAKAGFTSLLARLPQLLYGLMDQWVQRCFFFFQ